MASFSYCHCGGGSGREAHAYTMKMIITKNKDFT
jgi:hypothetical protein